MSENQNTEIIKPKRTFKKKITVGFLKAAVPNLRDFIVKIGIEIDDVKFDITWDFFLNLINSLIETGEKITWNTPIEEFTELVVEMGEGGFLDGILSVK